MILWSMVTHWLYACWSLVIWFSLTWLLFLFLLMEKPSFGFNAVSAKLCDNPSGSHAPWDLSLWTVLPEDESSIPRLWWGWVLRPTEPAAMEGEEGDWIVGSWNSNDFLPGPVDESKGNPCFIKAARLSITMDCPCGEYAYPGSVSVCPITFYCIPWGLPSPFYKTKGFKSVLIPTGDKTESKRASKDLASSVRKNWDPLREGSRAARTWMECPQGWSGDEVPIAWGPPRC